MSLRTASNTSRARGTLSSLSNPADGLAATAHNGAGGRSSMLLNASGIGGQVGRTTSSISQRGGGNGGPQRRAMAPQFSGNVTTIHYNADANVSLTASLDGHTAAHPSPTGGSPLFMNSNGGAGGGVGLFSGRSAAHQQGMLSRVMPLPSRLAALSPASNGKAAPLASTTYGGVGQSAASLNPIAAFSTPPRASGQQQQQQQSAVAGGATSSLPLPPLASPAGVGAVLERAEALAASLGRDLLMLQRFMDTKTNTALAAVNAVTMAAAADEAAAYQRRKAASDAEAAKAAEEAAKRGGGGGNAADGLVSSRTPSPNAGAERPGKGGGKKASTPTSKAKAGADGAMAKKKSLGASLLGDAQQQQSSPFGASGDSPTGRSASPLRPPSPPRPFIITNNTLALRKLEEALIGLKARQSTDAAQLLLSSAAATSSSTTVGGRAGTTGGGKSAAALRRLSASVPFASSSSFVAGAGGGATASPSPLSPFQLQTAAASSAGDDVSATEGDGSSDSQQQSAAAALAASAALLARIVGIAELLSEKSRELAAMVHPAARAGLAGDEASMGAPPDSAVAAPLVTLAQAALNKKDVRVAAGIVEGGSSGGAADGDEAFGGGEEAEGGDGGDAPERPFFVVTRPLVAPTAPVRLPQQQQQQNARNNNGPHQQGYGYGYGYGYEVVGTPPPTAGGSFAAPRGSSGLPPPANASFHSAADVAGGPLRKLRSSIAGAGGGGGSNLHPIMAAVGTNAHNSPVGSLEHTASGSGLLPPRNPSSGPLANGHNSDGSGSGGRRASSRGGGGPNASVVPPMGPLPIPISSATEPFGVSGGVGGVEDYGSLRSITCGGASSSPLSPHDDPSASLLASPLPLTRRAVRAFAAEAATATATGNGVGVVSSGGSKVNPSVVSGHVYGIGANRVDPAVFYSGIGAALPLPPPSAAPAIEAMGGGRGGTARGSLSPAGPSTAAATAAPTPAPASLAAPHSHSYSSSPHQSPQQQHMNAAAAAAANPLAQRLQQQLFPTRLSMKAQALLADLGLLPVAAHASLFAGANLIGASPQQQLLPPLASSASPPQTNTTNAKKGGAAGGSSPSSSLSSAALVPMVPPTAPPRPLAAADQQSLALALQQQLQAAASDPTSPSTADQQGGSSGGAGGAGGNARRRAGGANRSGGGGDHNSAPGTPSPSNLRGNSSGGVGFSGGGGGGLSVGFATIATPPPMGTLGLCVTVPPVVTPVDLYGNYGLPTEALGDPSVALEAIADYCLCLQSEHAGMERRMAMTRRQLEQQQHRGALERTAFEEALAAAADERSRLLGELSAAKGVIAALAAKEAAGRGGGAGRSIATAVPSPSETPLKSTATTNNNNASKNGSGTPLSPGAARKARREAANGGSGSDAAAGVSLLSSTPPPQQPLSSSSSPATPLPAAAAASVGAASPQHQHQHQQPAFGGLNEEDHLSYRRTIALLEQRLAVAAAEAAASKEAVTSDEAAVRRAQQRATDLEAEVARVARRVTVEQTEHGIAKQQISDLTQLRKEEAKMCAVAVKHLEERLGEAKGTNDGLQRRLDLLSANFKKLFEDWVLSDARADEFAREAEALGRELAAYRALFSPALVLHLEALQERYLTALASLDEAHGTVAGLRQDLDHVNLQRKLALSDTKEFVDNIRKSAEWKLIAARLPEEAAHLDQKMAHLSLDRDRRIVDISLKLQAKSAEFAAKVSAEAAERAAFRSRQFREEDVFWQDNGCEEMRRVTAHSLAAAFYRAAGTNARTDLSELCHFSRAQSEAMTNFKGTQHPSILQGANDYLSGSVAAVALGPAAAAAGAEGGEGGSSGGGMGGGSSRHIGTDRATTTALTDDGRQTTRSARTTATAKSWRTALRQANGTQEGGATAAAAAAPNPALSALRDPAVIRAFVGAAMSKETNFGDFLKEQAAARAME